MQPKRRYATSLPVQPDDAPKWDDFDVWRHRPGGYLASQPLVDAVNVALILGKPLLVTGEPGSGKTELAWSIAWQLALHPPLTFETRSTSTARDLFYTYDAIRHFRLSQTNPDINVLQFLTLNALGRAIFHSRSPAEILKLDEKLIERFNEQADTKNERSNIQSVVLIDEIDKAPRDFPNDLLNEFAEHYFTIVEYNNYRIDANRSKLPILILTSNSEKNLPDAFLRRCIFHNIRFPERDNLKQILYNRVGEFTGESTKLFNDAIDYFLKLRNLEPSLEKKPATAELIDWLKGLQAMGANWQNGLTDQSIIHRATIGALVKDRRDEERVIGMIEGLN